jgi:predicted extracellular nuclease
MPNVCFAGYTATLTATTHCITHCTIIQITLDGTATVPAAATLPNFTVPNYNLAGLEQLEGMRVTFSNLAVTDTYTSGRYGELGLTSTSSRLFTCTVSSMLVHCLFRTQCLQTCCQQLSK